MFITVEEFDCLFFHKLEGHDLWSFFLQRRQEKLFQGCVYFVNQRHELLLSQLIRNTEHEYFSPANNSEAASVWIKLLIQFQNCYLLSQGLSMVEVVDIRNRVEEYQQNGFDPKKLFVEGQEQPATRFTTKVFENAKRLTGLGRYCLKDVVISPFFSDVVFEFKNIRIPQLQSA